MLRSGPLTIVALQLTSVRTQIEHNTLLTYLLSHRYASWMDEIVLFFRAASLFTPLEMMSSCLQSLSLPSLIHLTF